MATSVSLRRSLRKIPWFRSLSGRELAEVIHQLIYKEYKPGDVLWRAGNRLDFLGIIQSGEIVLEYQINGSARRSVRLTAGDYVMPRDQRRMNSYASTLARAVTDVRLCILHMEQDAMLQPKWLPSGSALARSQSHSTPLLWSRLWIAIVALLIIFMNWHDISRVLAGTLYLASARADPEIHNHQGPSNWLGYAETIAPDAAFLHNQEGTIWYKQNNLQGATAAFTKAVEIDQQNGSALNNLAVMNFMEGQTQQATLLLEKAVQHEPNRAFLRYNLGIALANQKHYEEAIREFKEATYIEPNWSLPYLEQSFIYIQMQDYLNAEEAARAAVRLDPGKQSAHLVLAVALYDQSKSQEALTSVENALQMDPNDDVAKFYKGLILSKLGEFESALLILQQLLDSTDDPVQVSRITAEIEAVHRYLENP